MKDGKLPESLVAIATLSPKCVNQDACAVVKSCTSPTLGVVVCDGIGSHLGAEYASAYAADSIAQELNQLPFEAIAALDASAMTRIYKNACITIAERSVQHETNGAPALAEFPPGTTALTALELQHSIVLAYTGNGSIWHVRANFNEFPEAALLPWSAINLLNPHSQPVKGKNQLFRFLSATAGPDEATPSVIMLSKDEQLMGDIIAVVTDGIWSYDQAVIGQNEMGVWIHAESTLPLLYRHLNEFFRRGNISESALQAALNVYLDAVRASGKMADDITIGLLITGRAVAYQRSMNARVTSEDEHEITYPSVVA
jgi:serine/threonine protein phosphatase PrpC